jgi:hypothetical protein
VNAKPFYRRGRSSLDKEGREEEPEPECDDDWERVELDFASSFCDWYSEGIGKYVWRGKAKVDARSLLLREYMEEGYEGREEAGEATESCCGSFLSDSNSNSVWKESRSVTVRAGETMRTVG